MPQKSVNPARSPSATPAGADVVQASRGEVRGRARIGLLSIGQSPRPDLVATLPMLAGLDCVEAGALDGLDAATLPPAGGAFPLTTRMHDGTLVVVDESFLLPRMLDAVRKLERADVAAILLMCAGTFDAVESNVPLFKPFDLVCAALRAWGLHSPLVICPFAAQEAPMRKRWADAGFAAQVRTAQLTDVAQIAAASTAAAQAQCVVLDYFGHAPAQVAPLRAALSLPVIDIGTYTAACLAAVL